MTTEIWITASLIWILLHHMALYLVSLLKKKNTAERIPPSPLKTIMGQCFCVVDKKTSCLSPGCSPAKLSLSMTDLPKVQIKCSVFDLLLSTYKSEWSADIIITQLKALLGSLLTYHAAFAVWYSATNSPFLMEIWCPALHELLFLANWINSLIKKIMLTIIISDACTQMANTNKKYLQLSFHPLGVLSIAVCTPLLTTPTSFQ